MDTCRRALTRASKSLGVLCLISAAVFGSSSAHAQYAFEGDGLLPPRAVAWRLNDRGFTELSRPRFDGRAYIVEASSPYGERVRLFVDARDGAIVGRQRLGAPVPPPERLVRRAPAGYGWTEEDGPGHSQREAAPLLPPGDIPYPGTPSRRVRPETTARLETPVRPESVDRNPLGLNPDGRGDAVPKAEPQRKAARPTAPAKPLVPRASPEAPRLSDTPPAPAEARTAPSTASIAPPQASTSPTPAAVQPPPADKPAAQNWKDLPADTKRPVRVIGGATVVPGTTAKE